MNELMLIEIYVQQSERFTRWTRSNEIVTILRRFREK
jgi:hypothetical protein